MSEILLISSDLQARARVEAAAEAAGLAAVSRSPRGGLPEELAAAVIVLDLDELGDDLPQWVGLARSVDATPRLVGFFSHVQEPTGARAEEMGVEVYPRGRFWRQLPELLTAMPPGN